MNLLYFITGSSVCHHSQCYFSILSFYKKGIKDIYIYTDYPEFYNRLGSVVNIIELTEKNIKEWRGESDFFWRIKMKTIEDLIKKGTKGPIIYLDTDTFLYKPFTEVEAGLKNGTVAYMHKNEGPLSSMKHTAQKMWKQIENKTFGGVIMDKSVCMWNAGVVAIPQQKNIECIELAINVCDDMLKSGVTPIVIEQFSLSVALNHIYNLVSAESFIAHYWGNKDDWNKEIINFCASSFLQNTSFEEDVDMLDKVDIYNLPYCIPHQNTKEKLMRILNKLFPPQKFMLKK